MPEDTPPDLLAKLAHAGSSERGLLHFLLENIPDRIYFKDADSRFIRISRAMAKMFGLSSALEAVGKSDSDYFTSEHAEQALADERQVIRTGQPIIGKIEKETLPDGGIGWVITTKMPLRNAQGEIVGTCGISKDFTAQKALGDELHESNRQLAARQDQLERALAELRTTQQQLVEAEKMQMIGRLASGVAHEIRNPLNILHAGLDFLAHEDAVAGDQSNAVIMEEMRTAVRRADAVICALMDSAAEASLRLEPCEVSQLLAYIIAAQEADLRHAGIRVTKEFADDLPALELDRTKMEQVFGGLIKNAADAMRDGGQLTVRARRHTVMEAEVTRDPGLRSGDRLRAGDVGVLIEIDDTGRGILDEALPKVFDPFFTTKETGSGAGLGLTVCRKIVQLHHGTLQLANREEGGVRATIFLKAGGA